MLVFLSSCYDYNDYKVDNIVSINYNQQIIRKSLTIDVSDGYFNYKNEPNSQQQPLLNTIIIYILAFVQLIVMKSFIQYYGLQMVRVLFFIFITEMTHHLFLMVKGFLCLK